MLCSVSLLLLTVGCSSVPWVEFGCPNARDPNSHDGEFHYRCSRYGEPSGGPDDGEFQNLGTGQVEKRFGGGNILDENISRDSNGPGSLSMANTGQKNSGGSQFFLNVANNSNLDWFSPGASKHPVFGKVTEGYQVLVAISKVQTNNDNPVVPIKMNSITISGL